MARAEVAGTEWTAKRCGFTSRPGLNLFGENMASKKKNELDKSVQCGIYHCFCVLVYKSAYAELEQTAAHGIEIISF